MFLVWMFELLVQLEPVLFGNHSIILLHSRAFQRPWLWYKQIQWPDLKDWSQGHNLIIFIGFQRFHPVSSCFISVFHPFPSCFINIFLLQPTDQHGSTVWGYPPNHLNLRMISSVFINMINRKTMENLWFGEPCSRLHRLSCRRRCGTATGSAVIQGNLNISPCKAIKKNESNVSLYRFVWWVLKDSVVIFQIFEC